MQQLRFLFAVALLYMFRVTISPIIRIILLYQMAAFVLYGVLLVFLYW